MIIAQNLDICPDCENEVKLDEQGIKCDDCKQWWHAPCCKIDDQQYNWLSGKGSSGYYVKFTCKICSERKEEDTDEVISNAMLFKQMQQMMQTMSKVLTNYEKINETNDKLHQRIEKLELEKEKCSAQPLNDIKEFVVEKVGEALSEAREKEARKLNLLLVNVPENPGEDAQEKDMVSVNKIMKKIMPDDEVKVTNLVRLPMAKGQTNIGRAPRMMKIKVEDIHTKRKILSNSYKLNEGSDITDPKKKLYINQDLTREERIEGKKLREALRNHPDRDNMKIKGNKLVPKESIEDNDRDKQGASGKGRPLSQ